MGTLNITSGSQEKVDEMLIMVLLSLNQQEENEDGWWEMKCIWEESGHHNTITIPCTDSRCGPIFTLGHRLMRWLGLQATARGTLQHHDRWTGNFSSSFPKGTMAIYLGLSIYRAKEDIQIFWGQLGTGSELTLLSRGLQYTGACEGNLGNYFS